MKNIRIKLQTSLLLIFALLWAVAAQAESHQLKLSAQPAMAGSFNTGSATLEAGETIHLYAYSNSNFSFVQWKDAEGRVVSKQMDFTYTMPSGDSRLTAEFEYNPANPANPAKNYWNKELGEVIIDDFTTGALQSAVKSAVGGASSSDVAMMTVAGVINSNDFGVINTYGNCLLLDLSRVAGVAQVPSYAFDYSKLESVYLPATIEKIGYRAFYSCQQLSSLIVYAMTPPALEGDVFTGVPDGLVVYVPAAAIAQYQDAAGWKSFTILPIQEDIRSISVSLPEGANADDYRQMWLELTNTKSGQRMHYVMTDRTQYTFSNIIRNTSWSVTLRNERGDVFGKVDNVEVKDEDVSVVFSTLSKPQNVSLAVQTPDGQTVTAQTQVTWTDAQGNYVAQGAVVSGLPVGYKVKCRVTLSQELAMLYDTPQTVEYELTDGGNNIVCHLEAVKPLQISGRVKDVATGLPLSGATVSASQTFGGKYSKTLNAKTDNNGVFTLSVANVPTSVTVAATDYVSQTFDYGNGEFEGLTEFSLPDVSLKSITGAIVSIGFTYTSVEGETQKWYNDYQNVSYTLYNVSKGRAISQYNVQFPQIVLLEEVDDGDVLRLTATSRTNTFMPVEATATIAEQKAEATFAVVELGQIRASFTTTGNASVVGSLYDAAGKLVKTYDYANASLMISNLADGQYTLVSMGSSRMFNTIFDLAQLPQTGLAEGSDYVRNTVEVKSGAVSVISISEVPTLDESKLYYTGDNTSFTVNKPSITVGNYLTLTGRVDFKPAYATSVSNVQMIVDLPESCEFVENSVMVGNNTSGYTLNGNRITIPMTRYTDRVRFCIIPTVGGEYAPSAFAQFDINGETVTQPIGSTNYTAKNLSISVPSTVAKTTVPISGTAIGASSVEVYDNGVLIGQTTSLANGTWVTMCELTNAYNLSRHNIQARTKTRQGQILLSENVACIYDRSAIEVDKVTMINTAHPAGTLNTCEYVTVFDFKDPSKPIPSYWYWPSYPQFTFIVDFTNNDPEMVSNVVLHVFTNDNKVTNIPVLYDEKTGSWVTSRQFSSGNLPINVSVSFQNNISTETDLTEVQQIDDEISTAVTEGEMYDEDFKQQVSQLKQELQKENYSREKVDSLLDLTSEYYSRNIRAIERVLISGGRRISPYSKKSDAVISEIEGASSSDQIMNIINALPEIDAQDLQRAKDFIATGMPNGGMTIPTQCRDGVYLPTVNLSGPSVGGSSDKKTPSGTLSMDYDNSTGSDNALDRAKITMTNKDGDAVTMDFTDQARHLGVYDVNVPEVSMWEAILDSYADSWNLLHGGGTGLDALATLLAYTEQCQEINAAMRALNTRELRAAQMEKLMQRAWDYTPEYSRLQGIAKGLSIAGTALGAINTIHSGREALGAYRDWDDICNQIRGACSVAAANDIIAEAEEYKKWIGRRKICNAVGNLGLVLIGAGGALLSAPSMGCSLALTGLAVGGGVALDIQNAQNEREDLKHKADILGKVLNNKNCKPLPAGTVPEAVFIPVSPVLDPSGYVYEAVSSNRIEGVTATAYYKETIEDMYGDLHEHIVKWDAAEYAQENPLFTDENGMYAWDVPQGLWQVKFEKEGYETTYSEWLPVPPPQLDVNIGMKQNVQPIVKSARAYEDAIEMEFDKYMMSDLLTTDNISVLQGNNPVAGSVELLNAETAYDDETAKYASKVRFNADQAFDTETVTLFISNRVKSYAGIRMQDNYEQSFAIEQEIKRIDCEPATVIGYGDTKGIKVSAYPAVAAKGKTLRTKSSSPMILGVEHNQALLDENGEALIVISGELPGSAALTFAIDGTDMVAETVVNVEPIANITVATPTSSIASGSTVAKGTEIRLSCATEGAVIYFTLDGSCPCDDSDSRMRYDGNPIIVSASVTIKAMAVANQMYDSEVAEFQYIVNDNTGVQTTKETPKNSGESSSVYTLTGAKLKKIKHSGLYIVDGVKRYVEAK